MLREMGHFKSRLGREIGIRQECQISQYFTEMSGKSRPIHFLLKWPLLIYNRV